ncbi:hypothetical protein ROZALSC1DRAFT_28418 [Rozella allomycis CSF55]|uniref:Uncharacterized protein n=1 Tax=Rozella allomycis (strain CSF55) TaxID=988480 RepID=A0A075AMD7_ROZAC|nr:hypothetical protein O9G_005562 [Rozella allomycis CSF55]RKP20056.1 hypothetical protein ROZALSC1DRAFT_28418 [Rozella allomycis CSF55]|eukprot:EPZ30764.1 hypothetical protein O9G_005562 [Rozella allomycis CSF55]
MFSTKIPDDIHAEGALRRALNIKPTRFSYTLPINFVDDSGNIDKEKLQQHTNRFYRLQETVNCHAHSATCRKGSVGMLKCRLARPQAIVDKTRPIMIQKRGTDTVDLLPVSDLDIDISYDKLFKTINDNRTIAWESERPYLKNTLMQFLPKLSNTITSNIHKLSDDEIWTLNQDFKERNGWIVETNDVLASVLNCNTEACSVGGEEQAKTILFYLLKYLNKEAAELSTTINVIKEALHYVKQNPSHVPEKDTDETRFGKYFLQRLQNRITGLVEISDTQAAAYLLGLPASSCTHAFTYCFAQAAIEKVKSQFQKFKTTSYYTKGKRKYEEQFNDSDDYSEDSNYIDDDEFNDDENNNDMPIQNMFNAFNVPMQKGTGTIYRVKDKLIPISQDINYLYRGCNLQMLNLYEYCSLIRIIPKTNDDEEIQRSSGRPTNGTYNFERQHPLYQSHTQQLLSKHLVPIVAGCKVPRLKDDSTKSEREKFALFIMTIFSPWKNLGIPVHGISYKSLQKFLDQLNENQYDNTINLINQSRIKTINNISKNLTVNKNKKKLLSIFRGRNATKWTSEINKFTGRGSELTDEEIECTTNRPDIEAEIQSIRDHFAVDLNIVLNDPRIDYAQSTVENLNGVLSQITPSSKAKVQHLSNINNQTLQEMFHEIIKDDLKEIDN